MAVRTLWRGRAAQRIDFADGASLAEVLREGLGDLSVVQACANRSCGACRVLVNGSLELSCALRWEELPESIQVATFEDVKEEEAAMLATEAFLRDRPTRCRLCVAPLAVTAVALARSGRAGKAAAVDDAVAGMTCVCTGRGSLRRALLTK